MGTNFYRNLFIVAQTAAVLFCAVLTTTPFKVMGTACLVLYGLMGILHVALAWGKETR